MNTAPTFLLRTRLASPRGFASKKMLLIGGGALGGLLVILLVVMFLNRGAASSQPTTLTYWGLWESPEVMQPLIEAYQDENPHVTIKYEQRPIEQHYSTVRARISQAGVTDSFPDIVRVHNTWVPVLSNYLSPMPQTIYGREEYESTFYPATKDNLLINDDYYGIPLMIDGLALVYNQDLFNKAGVSAPPATWDDVRDIAAKIAQRDQSGNLTVGGIAMGTAYNVDHYADIVGLLMVQNGVAFQDANGNVNFHQSITSDGRNLGAEALSFYKLFSSSEKVWDDMMEPSTLAFSKGKVGMILVPSWRVLSLVDQNPQLQIRVAPVPHLTTEQNTGHASYWVETVPKASPHQAEAWKFLHYLSGREQQLALFNSAQDMRSFGEPYARTDLSGALSSDPLLAPYAMQSAGLRASLFASNTGAVELNEAINAALAQTITTAGIDGAAETSKPLTELAEQVTQILTEQRE